MQRAQDYASSITNRLDQFSAEQQRLLRSALRSRHHQADLSSWQASLREDAESGQPQIGQWLAMALPAIAWGEVALLAYEFLSNRGVTSDRPSYGISMQSLRALLITRLGALADDPILDPGTVVLNFFDALSITPEAARKKATKSRQQLADRATGPQLVRDLRQLRRIKNALGPLALLVENDILHPSPVLAEWLAMREILP